MENMKNNKPGRAEDVHDGKQMTSSTHIFKREPVYNELKTNLLFLFLESNHPQIMVKY